MGMVLIPNVSRALIWILVPLLWLACVSGLVFGSMAAHSAAPVAAIVLTALIVAADRLAKLRSRPAFILL